MVNKLKSIILQKQNEVARLHTLLKDHVNHPIHHVLQGNALPKRLPSFKNALKSSVLEVIAEIKRKSPSKGMMASISNPSDLAQQYIAGGAKALSILTDEKFFGGHLNDLVQVAHSYPAIPIIRKDFIIDNVQIAEAYTAGASAVLLIVSVLGHKTKALLEFAHSIHMDVLVEIHDHDELQMALDYGADIIGVNNRNLNTFEVDTERAIQLSSVIPNTIIKVAESGITEPSLARHYHQMGFDAVLIGEALVKSSDPKTFIKECRYD